MELPMSKTAKPTTTDAERKRATRATERIARLTKEARELKRTAVESQREAYGRGSAETLARVYYSIRDMGLPAAQWLSQRLLLASSERKPADLDKATALLVHREVMKHLRTCGQHSYAKSYQRKFGNGVVL
jgi:hypothetical protein